MKRWLMRFFKRTHPPERTIAPAVESRGPVFDAARQAYQDDKRLFLEHEAEREARLKRLGYDFEIATGRQSRGSD